MVKRVVTSIITVAILMGSLLACSSSDSEVAEPLLSSEDTPEEESLTEEPEEEPTAGPVPTPTPLPTPTPALTVPGVPTDLRKATASADHFSSGYRRIEWNAPTDTGGSPIISYTVTRTLSNLGGPDDGVTDFCVPTTTSCILTGHFYRPLGSQLPDRVRPVYIKTWTITVLATNSVGDSDPSEPITTSCGYVPDWIDGDGGFWAATAPTCASG